MKELSIEEKFKEAKRLYETANADQRYVLESLFPELKNPEDERIRKELIEYFQWGAVQYLNDFNNKKIVAWLEKQAQKPKQEWSESDKERIEELVVLIRHSNYTDGVKRKVISWLKSLKDRVQPQQEWSEKDETVLDNLIYALANDRIGNNRDEYVAWLKDLRERYIWKPSDEQVLALQESIGIVGEFTLRGKILKELEEQLKKLRDK